MSLTPRPARAADGAGIATCYLLSTAKLGGLRRCHGPQDMWRHFQNTAWKNDTWVIEHTGQLAAFMVLTPGWLEHLYVHPRYQGQGHGTSLLQTAKARLDKGFQLWTFQLNRNAQLFYEHHGLNVKARTDGRRNEEKLPDLLYVWKKEQAER